MRAAPSDRRSVWRPPSPAVVEDGPDRLQGRCLAPAGGNHAIGTTPLFGIRHLSVEGGGKPFRRHVRPRQKALPLNECWCGDHHHGVAEGIAAGFEQQRNIQHDDIAPLTQMPAEESVLFGVDQGVEDAFQAEQSLRVGEHPFREARAIDTVVSGDVGKAGGDGGNAATTRCEQVVNDTIGIEDRHAESTEHGRHGRLAHGRGAGEAEHDHASASPAATARRVSASTTGWMLNQAAKAGRA